MYQGKLLLVLLLGRGLAARRSKVLKVVAAQVHAKQFPQEELGRVGAVVVVRNQTMAQHEQGRQAQEQVAQARLVHDWGSDRRTKCHTRQARTALIR